MKFNGSLVWHKPGGFQPWNMPQFNHELVTYARKGSAAALLGEMDPDGFLAYCFDAPRGAHSQKPELFYEMLARAVRKPTKKR